MSEGNSKRIFTPYTNKDYVGRDGFLEFDEDDDRYIDVGNVAKYSFDVTETFMFSGVFSTGELSDVQNSSSNRPILGKFDTSGIGYAINVTRFGSSSFNAARVRLLIDDNIQLLSTPDLNILYNPSRLYFFAAYHDSASRTMEVYCMNTFSGTQDTSGASTIADNASFRLGDFQANAVGDKWNGFLGGIKLFNFGSGVPLPSNFKDILVNFSKNPYLVPSDFRQYCIGEYNLTDSSYYKDTGNIYGFGANSLVTFDSSGQYNVDRSSGFTSPAHGVLTNFTDDEVGAINPSSSSVIKDFYKINSELASSYLVFDGVDSYLDLGSVSKIPSSGSMSISFWVNPVDFAPSNTFSQRIIQNQNNSNGSTTYESGFSVNIGSSANSGKIIFGVTDGAQNSFQQIIRSDYSIPVNLLTHVLISKEGNDVNDWKMYFNGVEDKNLFRNTNSVVGNFSASANLLIGSTTITSPPSGIFRGSLSELTIFSNSYSPSEAFDFYNFGVEAGTKVLSLNFKETNGQTVVDTTANPATVTFNNFSTDETNAGGGAWLQRDNQLPALVNYLPLLRRDRYIDSGSFTSNIGPTDDFTIIFDSHIDTGSITPPVSSEIQTFFVLISTASPSEGITISHNVDSEEIVFSQQSVAIGNQSQLLVANTLSNSLNDYKIILIRESGSYFVYINGKKYTPSWSDTVTSFSNFLIQNSSSSFVSPEPLNAKSFSLFRRAIRPKEVLDLSYDSSDIKDISNLEYHHNFGNGAIYDDTGTTKIRNYGSESDSTITSLLGESTTDIQNLSSPIDEIQ